jgi:myosin-5
MLEFYTKNTVAWFKDSQSDKVYLSGTLTEKQVSNSHVKLTFMLENGSVHIYENSIKQVEEANYENLPLLKNPPKLEGVDDLTTLSYLHEYLSIHPNKSL